MLVPVVLASQLRHALKEESFAGADEGVDQLVAPHVVPPIDDDCRFVLEGAITHLLLGSLEALHKSVQSSPACHTFAVGELEV